MLLISDGAALARALQGDIGAHVKRLLALRRSQLGDRWPEAACFHLAEPGDTLADAEAAIGFPFTIEGEPTCEWAARHEGVTELCFVLSEDGPAQVLIVPHRNDIDPGLLGFASQVVQAANADTDHARPL